MCSVRSYQSPGCAGPLRAKKNASFRVGETRRKTDYRASCPPQTGRELAPADRQKAPVRLSWRRRARTPQPLCMKIAPRNCRADEQWYLGGRPFVKSSTRDSLNEKCGPPRPTAWRVRPSGRARSRCGSPVLTRTGLPQGRNADGSEHELQRELNLPRGGGRRGNGSR